MTKREVHIMAGNVGTGKSTTAKKIISRWKPGEFYIFDFDSLLTMLAGGYYGGELFKVPFNDEIVKDFKVRLVKFTGRHNMHFVIDDCHINRESRKKLIATAKDDLTRIIVHWHNYSDGVNRRFESNNRNHSKEKWQQVSDVFKGKLEAPKLDEGMDDIYYWDGCGKITAHKYGITPYICRDFPYNSE